MNVQQPISIKKNFLGLACLNVGCGSHYFSDWVNLDAYQSQSVYCCDLRERIPCDDNSFDVVYSSHVIEHFSHEKVDSFVAELFRVLKPAGVLRLLTPDLERLVQEYLKNLIAWNQDDTVLNRQRYEWIILELFDQMVRRESGGEMIKKLLSRDICEEYVSSRIGDEFKRITSFQKIPSVGRKPYAKDPISLLCYRIVSLSRRVVKRMSRFVEKNPVNDFQSVSGEIHRWYYDRVSLKHLLQSAGFVDFAVVEYKTSRIVGWERMNLDCSAFGNGPRKPDSIIVEVTKPN